MTKTEEKKRKNFRIPSAIWVPILFIVGIAIFVFGVPIVINEAYKAGPGYVTMWGAAEVLSFYGSVLGAVVTAASLFATIWFTRKQIVRDRFLERNLERWHKAEDVVTQALMDISPLNMRNAEKLDKEITLSINAIILNLQNYALKAKTCLNMIKCFITPEEYSKIEALGSEMLSAAEQFCKIEQELESEYMKLQAALIAGNGDLDNEILFIHLEKTNRIIEEVAPAYDGPYQRLLNMKRDVFDKIYSEVEMEANQLLLFKWRKPHAHS